MIMIISKTNSICSFDIFEKRVFGFVGIKWIVFFFFLATILIMEMINFHLS